jgi:hypothetical protein
MKPFNRASKIQLRFNQKKRELALMAQGSVTFFIALLLAAVVVLLWRLR